MKIMCLKNMAKTVLVLLAVSTSPVRADNAALQYWFAFNERHRPLPEYVDAATTDSTKYGFPVPISKRQRDFLQLESSRRIAYRFRKATSIVPCDWARGSGFAAQTEAINNYAHRVARVMLLYARREYEDRHWKTGNDTVLRTMVMARHVAGQIRPGENQCYMIENMARGTACAYLPIMPAASRTELARKIRRLPKLLPMRDAFYREAELSARLSNSLATLAKKKKHSPAEVTKLLRDICWPAEAQALQKKYSVDQLHGFAKKLATLQRAVGDLMKKPLAECDAAYHRSILPRIKKNPLARLVLGDIDSLRREDAQSECRAAMFFAAIDIVEKGDKAAKKHIDPFGSGPFRIDKQKAGFRLVSELKHSNNVDLVVGNGAPLFR